MAHDGHGKASRHVSVEATRQDAEEFMKKRETRSVYIKKAEHIKDRHWRIKSCFRITQFEETLIL